MLDRIVKKELPPIKITIRRHDVIGPHLPVSPSIKRNLDDPANLLIHIRDGKK